MRSINLATGENGLHPHYAKVVRELAPRGVKLSLTSNGYTIERSSDETIRAFREVEVSIDFQTEAAVARRPTVEPVPTPVESRLRRRHGNVLPCCIAPWITGHYDGIILGNPYQQSLEDIWWGQHYLSFRTAIQTDVPPVPCRGCGVKWSL